MGSVTKIKSVVSLGKSPPIGAGEPPHHPGHASPVLVAEQFARSRRSGMYL